MKDVVQRLLFFLGSRFGHLALLALGATWRVQVFGWETVEKIRATKEPLVMITWHGRMMVPTWHIRNRGLVTMISRHRDGELVARVVERLGFDTVRGSSTRGGTTAALEILEFVKQGRTAAMICDGPRGPIYTMKPGAAFLALQAKAAVIPASFAARPAWIFRSWDRFQMPKPLAKVVILYGDPIPYPGEQMDLKTFTRVLEAALNDLTATADRMIAQKV